MGIKMVNLRKSFGRIQTEVLRGINEEIKSGEMVSITGRSGSGKSTLLYIISTLDKPSSGEVIIDGENVSSLDSVRLHQFRNQNMGFVFQFHHLLPELTALENILMPALKINKNKAFESRARDLMLEFDLKDKFDHYPSELSGGEQQRVAVARALIMSPKYIFADEPTGNLDSINGLAVMKFLQKINIELKTTVIFVTHDREFSKMGHRQITLVDGLVETAESIKLEKN